MARRYEDFKGKKFTGKALGIGIVLFTSMLVISFTYLHLGSFPSRSLNKAAIVDQLSISQYNEDFIRASLEILNKAGYDADYFGGENVTVNFFKELPSRGYSLIILRVHSTAIEGAPEVGLFTSEIYDTTKHSNTPGLLNGVIFGSDTKYFGIGPEFVEKEMNGRFEGTTFILMGCDGLKHSRLGEAFVKKGARAFISWTGTVDVIHTDIATTHLLHALIQKRNSLREAVIQTNMKIGPDPIFGSMLRFYPEEAGDDMLLNIDS